MGFFSRFPGQGSHSMPVVTLQTRFKSLDKTLSETKCAPVLIVGFISPHIDINAVANTIKKRFPGATLTLTTTAGELCNGGSQLYCSTEGEWQDVVLQLFTSDLVQSVETIKIPLECSDLRGEGQPMPLSKRKEKLVNAIKSKNVKLNIDSNDTLAFILFDGLSASESFFMEALYESAKFPCLFVGGSAGGKLDFKNTYIHDGNQRLENHALVTFIKMPPHIRFGVFKSQNFDATDFRFNVLTGSVEKRYIEQVLSSKGEIMSMIDLLCQKFGCAPEQLEAKLADYSFAIRVGGELFVRSVAQFDLENKRVYLFCDVSSGEELILVKRTNIVERTTQDFNRFLQGKPGRPIAGLLNDCILRRLCNPKDLGKMSSVFKDIPLAGFSTFGEILGLNLNQTLTSIFWFDNSSKTSRFSDEYVDNFIFKYTDFKAFFQMREARKLSGLNQVVHKQIEQFKVNQFEQLVDPNKLDQKLRPIFSGLADLGQVLASAHEEREHLANELRSCASDLHHSMDELSDHVSTQVAAVDQAGTTISTLTNQSTEVASSAKELAQSSERIQNVVQVIQQIADQTNLLALNAAIEAARAGDLGRGFAVVSDEVRSLAEKSRNSADEIGVDINKLANEIRSVAQEIEGQSSAVGELSSMLNSLIEVSSLTSDNANRTKQVADRLVHLTGRQ